MFRGVTAALVTPVAADGTVDEGSLGRLVASVRPSVQALLPALSTGEGHALDDARWRAAVGATVRHAGGLPVAAGVLRPTTEQGAGLAREAARLGAAAVVTTTPWGAGVTQEEMYRHFEELGRRSALPLIVYHESEVSGNELEFDTLLRVCALPSVAAVKDSSGSAAFTRRLAAARPDALVLAGLEHLLPESGPVDGHVVALANTEPELCAALLADPAGRGAELAAACERYGLLGDDWYLALKAELHRRGVLETARPVETGRVP
jgi:4-hydroxy-tetrahydrodipicolinate synthase